LLQKCLEQLCDADDDGVHPDGKFRIERVIRGSPELAKVLGCSMPPPAGPGCGLTGRVQP
jgi:hypothetical protein